jgi:hypothetical protein
VAGCPFSSRKVSHRSDGGLYGATLLSARTIVKVFGLGKLLLHVPLSVLNEIFDKLAITQ